MNLLHAILLGGVLYVCFLAVYPHVGHWGKG